MGIFDGFKKFIKKVFNIKTEKKETIKEEQIIKEEDIKSPKEEFKEEIISEEDFEEKEYKERNIERKLNYGKIDNQSKRLEKEINTKTIENIITKKYNSVDTLRNNKYDIYRNLIMKGIENDNDAEMIYRSGLLNKRIVGIVTISGIINHTKSRKKEIFNETMEFAGLTPDLALDRGLYDFKGNSYKINDFVNEFHAKFGLNKPFIKADSLTYNDIVEIKEVDITFNYNRR